MPDEEPRAVAPRGSPLNKYAIALAIVGTTALMGGAVHALGVRLLALLPSGAGWFVVFWTAVVAIVTGFVATVIAYLVHARGRFAPALVGAICGAGVLWLSWACWATADGGFDTFLVAPAEILASIEHAIGKRSSPASRWVERVLWALEGLALVLGPAVLAARLVHDSAYCRTCRNWADHRIEIEPLTTDGLATAAARAEEGDLAHLLALPTAPVGANEFGRVELTCCETCGAHPRLTVVEVTPEDLDDDDDLDDGEDDQDDGGLSEEGEEQDDEDDDHDEDYLVDGMYLTAEQRAEVLRFAERVERELASRRGQPEVATQP